MPTSLINPVFHADDSAGRPLVGGRLRTYRAGTSTPAPTYRNSAGAPNTNPIILDGRGEAMVYLDGSFQYKLVLEDARGSLVWSADNVVSADFYANLLLPNAVNAAVAAVQPYVILAQQAQVGAEAARDAAIVGAGLYPDEPTGRAAVADGQNFKVQGSGDVAAYEYRRINASSSVLIAAYPSAAAVQAIRELVSVGPRQALNIKDAAGWVLGWFNERGGLYMPNYSIDVGTGLNTVRIVDPFGFVALDTGKLLQRLQSLESRPVPVNAYPHYGGQLGQLKAALCDPFMQFLGVVYAGDSITWGESASGNSTSTPRAHALTDARNNITAGTWANILTKHMGRNYFGKASPDISVGWPGSPSGECQFSYTKQFRVMPRSNERIGAWSVAVNSSAALKQILSTSTAVASDGGSIRITFTGTAFSVVHQVRADGAPFEVFVDGVSKGVLQTSTAGLGVPAQYGYVQAIDLGGFKRGAQIELRAKAGAAAVFALEAVQVDRVLRVTNQGLIGTDSREWVNTLFAASVRADDSFALIQIGTNDRVGNSSSVGTLQSNLEALVSQARIRNIAPVLMCANATTDASATLNAMQRAATLETARTLNVDFIDQQPITQAAIDRGDPVLADGLHPADLGHSIMGGNAVNQLEVSNVY